MPSVLVDLKSRRLECEERLLAAPNGNPDVVATYLATLNLSPDEVRNLVDVAAKGALSRQMQDETSSSSSNALKNHENLIELLTRLVSTGQCSPLTVTNLLTEMFDQSPLAQCQSLFRIIEDRANLWKSEQYFEPCKNVLLRACNDLLRRSSKSLDTVFCGRVQLFLSRLFPLDEKSALNLMGQFNLENVTHFRTEPWEGVKSEPEIETLVDGGEPMEVNEATETVPKQEPNLQLGKSLLVDFELYSKFWSLQETFRNPNALLTSKDKFQAFEQTTSYITSIFRTYPLEEDESQHQQQQQFLELPMAGEQGGEQGVFFSKYLTNEKLLDLQLSDSNFRRCILLQFLITLQYLVTPAKIKGQMTPLSADQEKLVKEMTENCYQLLKKTPPRGEHFAESVQKILASEESWSKWKNDSCPSFVKSPESLTAKRLRRRRPLGDELAASMTTGRPIRFGSAELNRLFATTSGSAVVDNLPVCRSATAQPELREFFTESITQLDPESKVLEEQKLLRKSEWQWRALRLLTSAGPQFFTSGGDRPSAPQKKLAMSVPDFLDIQMRQMAPGLGIKVGNPAQEKAAGQGGTGTGAGKERGGKTGAEVKAAKEAKEQGSISNTASPGAAVTDPQGQDGAALVTSEQMEADGTLDEAPIAGDSGEGNNNGAASTTTKATTTTTTSATTEASGATGGGDAGGGSSKVADLGPLVRDHKQAIALLVSAHWQNLAKHLKFEEDEVAYFETQDADDKSKQAQRMLELWEERESNYGRHPVPLSQFESELRRVAGLESIADRLRQLPSVASPGGTGR